MKNRKSITQVDEHLADAYEEFINEFASETERAAVILATSKIDSLLSLLISNVLLPFPGKEDDLLDEERQRPLTSLAARISVCHRLGIVNAEFAKTLHAIRKIRNDFAHEISGAKLNLPPYRDQIRSLVTPFSGTDLFKDVKISFFSDKTGAIADFMTLLSIIIARLDTLSLKVERLEDSHAFSLIHPKYRSRLKTPSEQRGKK